MQQKCAFFGCGSSFEDLAPHLADAFDLLTDSWAERIFELASKAVSQSGALAGCGNCNLQRSAANHGGEVEIAIRWIVDAVRENAALLCFEKDGAIDAGVRRCGNSEKRAGKVVRREWARQPANFARRSLAGK